MGGQQGWFTRQLKVGAPSVANVAKISEASVWTVNINPAAMTVANDRATTLFACSEAAIGDFVLVSAPYDLVDTVVTGYVLNTGNIEIVTHQPLTTANIDLAAGDWKVLLIKAS